MKLPLSILRKIIELPDNFDGSFTVHKSGESWKFEDTEHTRHKGPDELVDLATMLDFDEK